MTMTIKAPAGIAEPHASLTPYDTGEVLEPKPWVRSMAGLALADFGKVDFDNAEAATVATVQIVRNDNPGATVPYTIRISGHDYSPADFNIEWME
ncbi:hypothetical protein ACSHWG_00800 [Leucobacter sp. Z1108]|uniref:hypothetical protein n=1 Tax=Leucobacter sp. Z1108 TaxID=3439066 RepID=UPI003F37C649